MGRGVSGAGRRHNRKFQFGSSIAFRRTENAAVDTPTAWETKTTEAKTAKTATVVVRMPVKWEWSELTQNRKTWNDLFPQKFRFDFSGHDRNEILVRFGHLSVPFWPAWKTTPTKREKRSQASSIKDWGQQGRKEHLSGSDLRSDLAIFSTLLPSVSINCFQTFRIWFLLHVKRILELEICWKRDERHEMGVDFGAPGFLSKNIWDP